MNYDLKIYAEDIDPTSINQIYELMAQPTFQKETVRIMPDAHAGIGCVVGFTSTMSDKVIPNVIGVDIGCGMRTVFLGNIDIDYPLLDKFIKKNIPAGTSVSSEYNGEDLVKSLYVYDKLQNLPRIFGSIGSLGGGNHFIEIDIDKNNDKYLIIHSGSRNLGTQVASIYQKMAIDDCKNCANDEKERAIEELKAQGRVSEIPDELKRISEVYSYRTKIPNQLCYLDGTHLLSYIHDMKICQEFALRNRTKIAEKILKHLGLSPERQEVFETVHNYIADDNIIRKGAISAKQGEKVLIPMNMRDGCLIAIGKGNEDWNNSAPHGAGRLYCRSTAKEMFTVEEFQKEMEGIYSTTIQKSTLDESPMAYKSADVIERLVIPTVDIVEIIKPVYNFKAGG